MFHAYLWSIQSQKGNLTWIKISWTCLGQISLFEKLNSIRPCFPPQQSSKSHDWYPAIDYMTLSSVVKGKKESQVSRQNWLNLKFGIRFNLPICLWMPSVTLAVGNCFIRNKQAPGERLVFWSYVPFHVIFVAKWVSVSQRGIFIHLPLNVLNWTCASFYTAALAFSKTQELFES